jgi:hypothetical protein
LIKKVFTGVFINIIYKSSMALHVCRLTRRPDGVLDHIKLPVEGHADGYNIDQLGALGLCEGSRTSTLSCLAGWEFKVERIPYPFERQYPNYQWFEVTTLVQGI